MKKLLTIYIHHEQIKPHEFSTMLDISGLPKPQQSNFDNGGTLVGLKIGEKHSRIGE